MAAVRKGSRRITVDGQPYRWRIRQKPSYSQGMVGGLSFSVEQIVAKNIDQTILVVDAPNARPPLWGSGPPDSPVLPSHVARAIRAARHDGWEPLRPGKPFFSCLPVADFVHATD